MSLREKRSENREAILQGRFITHVLEREARDLDADIAKRTGGFTSPFWKDRSFSVTDNKLTYTHARGHRFVDMKRRASAEGVRAKRNHAVHNRPIYGHANEIVKGLVVGYTDAVREEMMKLDGTQI